MSWLYDFEERIKLTIDNTNVDSTLLDFPVLVKLSDSSGINSTDVTSVFVELGADANRKKIAITISDGTTQCYTEIERWDHSNHEAWLWVKVPSVTSAANTVLYLYYDSDHADNTSYIGDIGDTPAQNVWDDDFKLVMHMAQDPNGDVADAIKDSTSNANHGTPAGSMTTADLVDGKIGKAIDFDGSSDSLNLGDLSQVEGSDELTLENIIKATAFPSSCNYIIGKYGAYSTPAYGDRSFVFLVFSGGYVYFNTVDTAGDNRYVAETTNTLSISNYYNLAATSKAGSSQKIFIDGVEASYSTQDTYPAGQTIRANSEPAYISKYGGGTYHWQGPLDEIRVSTIARSTAWLKATYYSNWDGLISFGSEELIQVYASCHNTWINDPFIYKSTVSGINVYDLETTLLLNFIAHNYTSSVWANGTYMYVATTFSGIYRCATSTVTGTVNLESYKQYPEITSNYVYCIHGNGDYLCAATVSGVDHYNLITGSGIYTTLPDISKCFQTDRGEFYYTYNPRFLDKELHVVYSNTNNWDRNTIGYIYTTAGNINDLHVTEKTSRHGEGNIIFLATASGVTVIEEKPGDEENGNFKYYYINT